MNSYLKDLATKVKPRALRPELLILEW